MNLLFESPSWILSCAIVVTVSVLVALFALHWIRKHVPTESLQKNHDLVKCCLGMLGALYSIILGFTVVNVQDRYNKAFETVQTEAITLVDLYREASLFTEKETIRKSLRDYVDYVIREEWVFLKKHMIHPHTYKFIAKIWNAYYSVDLSDQREQIWYQESINRLNNFLDARLAKHFSSSNHLGSMMWTLLIFGGLINICLLLFFSFESAKNQRLIVALPVAYLAFMLNMVYSLDNVFQGPQGIKPVAFQEAIELFDRWDEIKE